MVSFSEFKRKFYTAIGRDISMFECGDINLLKVVLDGLKVNYVGKGKVRTYFFYPNFLYKLVLKYKARQSDVELFKVCLEKLKLHSHKEILISDVGRVYPTGNSEVKSSYFENIIAVLGKENLVHIADKNSNGALRVDFDIPYLTTVFNPPGFYLKHEELRKRLLCTFKNIKAASVFTKNELKNIKFAFQHFFEQFVLWNEILECLPKLNKTFFICHYHKEGQIYALKRKHIPCVELQHGLIAPQDIFYVFPELIKAYREKLLFADRMLVFGEYWQNVLLKGFEYKPEQIGIIGYYMYERPNEEELNGLRVQMEGKQVILVTTQTFLHQHFISFVEKVIEQEEFVKQNAVVILKPHPAEDINLYLEAFRDSKRVLVMQKPLALLFQVSKIHVSIYSTTVYDALRHSLKNYVFKVDGCEDYVDEILKAGIAEEVLDVKPWLETAFEISAGSVDPSRYYKQFHPEQLNIEGERTTFKN